MDGTRQPSLRDFMEDFASGAAYGVFIDDTGSPGLPTPSQNLHPERRTYAAVIVQQDQIAEVMEQLPQAVEGLHEIMGAREFHFTDIYAGKGAFQGVDLQRRLGIFAFMAEIFGFYNFPILIQTFDPNTLAALEIGEYLPVKVGPFDLINQDDAALLFLLVRVKWYIEELQKADPSVLARVFVDEGYRKHGTVMRVPTFENVFSDGVVCFADSSMIPPIQLADFAAFTLNRQQLLLAKKELTPLDVSFLKIASKVVFNYQNIEKKQFVLQKLGNGKYKILRS